MMKDNEETRDIKTYKPALKMDKLSESHREPSNYVCFYLLSALRMIPTSFRHFVSAKITAFQNYGASRVQNPPF